MAGPNLNINFTGFYQVVDVTTGTVYVTNRGFNFVLPASGSYDAQYINVGATAIVLPVATLNGTTAGTAYVAVVINHSTTVSVNVIYTPSSGISQTVPVTPGGMWALVGTTEAAGGLTALSLQTVSSTALVEYLIAA